MWLISLTFLHYWSDLDIGELYHFIYQVNIHTYLIIKIIHIQKGNF